MALLGMQFDDTTNYIKVVRKTYSVPSASQTVAPNTGLNVTLNVNDETGYKPIGIVGIERYGAANNFAVVSKFYINSSLQVYAQFENEGANTATVTTILFDVLYVRQ